MKRSFHQELALDVNVYVIKGYLLMVIVDIVLIHMLQEALERK
jgi:hypothetical protein